MRPQCEAQVGVRPTLMYNAVMIPVAVICPHFAEPGSKYCERHQDRTLPAGEIVPSVGDIVRLTARGIASIQGLRTPEEVEAQTNGFRVLGTFPIGTQPELYCVRVEGPLDRWDLTHLDVEKIR